MHVSPHPDDEALGAPATLLLLRRAGWRVVNAVVSLGRPADRERRRAEASEAAARADFALVLPDAPFAISRDDDLALVEPRVAEWLAGVMRDEQPSIVMSPSSADVHPGHEVVARATATAIAGLDPGAPWWTWGLWADLPQPNLYVPFDEDVLEAAHHVLSAYTGELARNDYLRLLDARAVAHAVLGSERVFGFGSARASTLPYADLLTERLRAGAGWTSGLPRVVDPGDPLP